MDPSPAANLYGATYSYAMCYWEEQHWLRAKSIHAVRMLQKKLGKQDPTYTDYLYWKNNGWTGSVRPWKQTPTEK